MSLRSRLFAEGGSGEGEGVEGATASLGWLASAREGEGGEKNPPCVRHDGASFGTMEETRPWRAPVRDRQGQGRFSSGWVDRSTEIVAGSGVGAFEDVILAVAPVGQERRHVFAVPPHPRGGHGRVGANVAVEAEFPVDFTVEPRGI